MTTRPSYVVHEVKESEVTIDWFFGSGHGRTKVTQLVLVLIGWFFTVLPVVITASALLNRGNSGGWWNYSEGFAMWDRTMAFLGIVTVVFVVGYFALYLVNRSSLKERNRRRTYDEQRLAKRTELAAVWYANKYGPESLRLKDNKILIEPFNDVETFELRGLYRNYGVD
jgi:uncharacterized membrane protein